MATFHHGDLVSELDEWVPEDEFNGGPAWRVEAVPAGDAATALCGRVSSWSAEDRRLFWDCVKLAKQQGEREAHQKLLGRLAANAMVRIGLRSAVVDVGPVPESDGEWGSR